ncbi:MAG: DUF1150 family protein [Pseudomonadota bacterium]
MTDQNQIFVTADQLRHLSEEEVATLGMQDFAYIKQVIVDDEINFAIHAADGTQVAVMPEIDHAILAVKQHDLEPLRVH